MPIKVFTVDPSVPSYPQDCSEANLSHLRRHRRSVAHARMPAPLILIYRNYWFESAQDNHQVPLTNFQPQTDSLHFLLSFCRYIAASRVARGCSPFRKNSRGWERFSHHHLETTSASPRSLAGAIARTCLDSRPDRSANDFATKRRRLRRES